MATRTISEILSQGRNLSLGNITYAISGPNTFSTLSPGKVFSWFRILSAATKMADLYRPAAFAHSPFEARSRPLAINFLAFALSLPDILDPINTIRRVPKARRGGLSPEEGVKALTLDRRDIEIRSTLLPELTMVRPGDLIVEYEEGYNDFDNTDIQIGIVVGTGWGDDPALLAGLSYQEIREQIYLVSVNERLERVPLGTWGNPAGIFGGFALTPNRFQVRRLMLNVREE